MNKEETEDLCMQSGNGRNSEVSIAEELLENYLDIDGTVTEDA
jgi:hypothetical protein